MIGPLHPGNQVDPVSRIDDLRATTPFRWVICVGGVAVSGRACVAVEAMEGTDAVLRRAASLVNGRPLVLVKSGARRKHLLFDVPVVGVETVKVMRETGATALAVDAGRTLMLDREELLQRANEAHVAIVGYAPAKE